MGTDLEPVPFSFGHLELEVGRDSRCRLEALDDSSWWD